MSYCRFGEADAYIIPTGDALECILCSLMGGEIFHTTSRVEMLGHVILHRATGAFSPTRVDECLQHEIETEGDEVGDGLRSEDPPADEGAGGADAAGADEGSSP